MKEKSGTYIKFFGYLVLIVLANVAGITFFFRADLTENKLYSISEASRQVVSTLSEPLTINVFFTKNLPVPHNNTERYLHDLLEEYSMDAGRYFNYRFYDVSPEEGDMTEEAGKNRRLAKSYGIYPVQIQHIEEDEVKFQKAFMGLVLIQGDIIERIPTITSTEGLEYRLTMAMRKLNNKISALLGLEQKIRVRLFLSSSLEKVAPFIPLSGLPELPERLETIVKDLNKKNYGKLEFEHLDPTKDEGLELQVEKHNILSLRWPALADGEIQPGKGAIGLVIEHGAKAITLPLIHVMRIPSIGTHYQMTDMTEMEGVINENIESLLDINEDLGYLADHGTFNLGTPVGQEEQDPIQNLRKLISQSYTIKDVNLKEGDMPYSPDCLMIAGPTETFDDYALFQIDQFLMRGKSLAIFLDRFKEVMPPQQPGQRLQFNQGPIFVPFDTGLEKMLEHYGIRVKESYIMDENCYRQRVSSQMGGGEKAIYYIPLIKKQHINHNLAFMKNIKGLIAIKISPLELETDLIEKYGLRAHTLFSSSEKSWETTGRVNLNPIFLRPPQSDEEQESRPLAYLLEGRFPSYFDGKPIPRREEADTPSEDTDKEETTDEKLTADLSKIEGEGDFLAKGKPGRIFIMASPEMLMDNVIEAKGRSPNSMFIMNVLDYLNNREAIAVMRSKDQSFNPLNETEVGTKVFVKSFNIAGLPVLVVIFGLFVWFRRHSRKKRIEMMFQR